MSTKSAHYSRNSRNKAFEFPASGWDSRPLLHFLSSCARLKNINDAFGHHAGDQIIEVFSQLIRQETRSNEILCRYGGDEFVLILTQTSDEETLRCCTQ